MQNSYLESASDKSTNSNNTIESLNKLPSKNRSKTNKIGRAKEKEKAYFDINRSLHTKIIQKASNKKLITIKHIEEMLLYATKVDKETFNRPIIKIERSMIDSTLMDDEGKCETIHDQDEILQVNDEIIGYINKNVHESKVLEKACVETDHESKVLEKESLETDYKSRTILTLNSTFTHDVQDSNSKNYLGEKANIDKTIETLKTMSITKEIKEFYHIDVAEFIVQRIRNNPL